MPDAPRLLFVADGPAAVEALSAVREGGPVRAQLAPTADVLRDTLQAADAGEAWDAVVYVPGGVVEEVELAVYVPDGLRLFVVDDEVPLLLMETAAEALPPAALGTLLGRLVAAPPPVESAMAFPELSVADLLPDPARATAPPADVPAPVAAPDVPVPDPIVPDAPTVASSSLPEAPVPPAPEPNAHAAEATPAPPPETGVPEPLPPEPPAMDLPTVDLPTVDLPEVDLPEVELPSMESPAMEDLVPEIPPFVASPSDGDPADATPADGAPLARTGPEPASPDGAPDAPLDPFALPWGPPVVGGPPPDAPDPSDTAPADETGAMSDDLASLADHLPIGLFRTTPDGRILYANPALHALLGTDAPLASLDVLTDLEYPREAFRAEIAETGVVRNLVVSWTRPDGVRVHTRENARCLRDADGRVIAYEGTMEDVTAEVEGRREEQALVREHRAVAAFAAAAALAADPATIQCAAAGALLDATEAEWAALLTRDADGAVRAAASAGALPDGLVALLRATPALADHVFPFQPLAAASVVELDAPAEALDALLALGVGSFASVPVERAGRRYGALVWGRAERAAPGPGEGRAGEALAWHVGGQLERVAARSDLRDTEATLAVVAEHTPHVLYRLRYTDDGAVIDYLSPAAEALTGYTRDEIAARGGLRALIDRSETSEGAGLLEGPVAGAERFRAVYRIATADGPRWVEDVARPWHGATGRVLGLVGVVSDVTERRAREEALAGQAQRAVARQRALVDLAGLEGADAYGAPAASVVAATLEAAAVSFWTLGRTGTCAPLFAPPPRRLGGSLAPAVGHVAAHRALAIADVTADERVAALELEPFVRAYGLTALLVAPVRRDGRVAGLVAVHRTDGPHDWEPAEAEFAGAVADAIALALERDDRDLALAELEEARVAAEQGRAAAESADRLKSAFLATLSHEVRTPLTGILGYADLLAEEAPAPHRGAAVRIARNGRQLLDTLDAVLDLSRLEAGDVAFDLRPTAIAEPVHDAVAPYLASAQAKGVRLDLDLDPAARASVDAAALQRLVGHLVENAVGFTAEGGVHVAVEADGDEAVVRVADTGCGIAPDFLEEAFAPFRQEDPTRGGAGLGLALARRLARLLGGRIEIASEQPGGTVVTVAFPLVEAPPDPDAAAAAPPAEGDGLGASDPGDLLGQPFDFTFLTAPPALRPAAARPTTSPTPAPTDMFDFQFGRPQPSDPPAPSPSAEGPTDAPPSVEPVLFVRPREGAPRPTIPPAPVAAVEEAEVVSDGRPSVLVVEDNDDTRMLLERILRTTYAVTAVGDARSALLAMNQRRFSGLVLDINLGGKETGADVLRIARSLPDYGGVFAIALTAYALPGDRERLLESGFNAYISKPFTRASLMETLADGVTA